MQPVRQLDPVPYSTSLLVSEPNSPCVESVPYFATFSGSKINTDIEYGTRFNSLTACQPDILHFEKISIVVLVAVLVDKLTCKLSAKPMRDIWWIDCV